MALSRANSRQVGVTSGVNLLGVLFVLCHALSAYVYIRLHSICGSAKLDSRIFIFCWFQIYQAEFVSNFMTFGIVVFRHN